jgi:hypothetical protein
VSHRRGARPAPVSRRGAGPGVGRLYEGQQASEVCFVVAAPPHAGKNRGPWGRRSDMQIRRGALRSDGRGDGRAPAATRKRDVVTLTSAGSTVAWLVNNQ